MIPANPPSGRTLIKLAIGGLLCASAIFVTLILPSQYGIDPVGTGKLLGLTPTQGVFTRHAGEFKFNTVELTIAPNEGVEYKYHLPKGTSMAFSWKASAPLEQDYHSEPDTYPATPSVSFDQSTLSQGDGSFVSYVSGLYGWYWKNNGTMPVTVKVTGAGFFDYGIEMRAKGFRQRHASQSASEVAATLPKKGDTD